MTKITLPDLHTLSDEAWAQQALNDAAAAASVQPSPRRQQRDTTYLGDGVYVAHDGNGTILMSVNHHENVVVALENDILLRLIEYARRLGLGVKL